MRNENIQIQARLRPYQESDGKVVQDAINVKGKGIEAVDGKGSTHSFTFQHCHGADSTQEQVFTKIQPLIDALFYGENACVFAYGVTGSGKTHTMEGTTPDPGIIPRTMNAIMAKIDELRDVHVEVDFSYMEILKDEVYDLLADGPRPKKLDVRTDERGRTNVIGLEKVPMELSDEFESFYRSMAKKRTTAATNLNTTSSRSHSIATIHLSFDRSGHRSSTEIRLVDLAGSENNNLTGNNGERMRESASINKSLAALGNVIDQLRKGAPHVSYRDSKLTRILSHALGGDSQTLLLVCLAPGEKFLRDTINSLKFADRTSKVVNTISTRARRVAPRHTAPVVPSRPQVPEVQARRNTLAAPSAKRISVLPNAETSGPPPSTDAIPASGELAAPPSSLRREVPQNEAHKAWGHETIARVARDVTARLNTAPAMSPTAGSTSSADPLPAMSGTVIAAATTATCEVEEAEMSEKDKRLHAGVYAKKGRQEQRGGNLELALRHYQSALVIYPDQIKLQRRILEVQMELGQMMDGSVPAPTPRQAPTLAAGVRRVREAVDDDGIAGQSSPVRRRLEYARA